VQCWGTSNYIGSTTGPFNYLSNGNDHACVIKPDGNVKCWGNNQYYNKAPSDVTGPFISIACGDYHTCGIKPNGDAKCWGNNFYGQAPPDVTGPFISIFSGDDFSCAIKSNGDVKCWGKNDFAQAPPSVTGPFSCPVNCFPGWNSSTGVFPCAKCPAGTYSGTGAILCTQCPAGSYSSPGSDHCTSCKNTWTGCDTTADCCLGLQCRVGDRRCLAKEDFEYAVWVDNAYYRDATVITPGCYEHWTFSPTSIECCNYPDQVTRVGDRRCLTQGDFEYSVWVDNAYDRNGTIVTNCPPSSCSSNAPRYHCTC